MKRFPIGLVAASASVALWLACGDGNPPTNTPTMTLSANRYTLPNDGTPASISVTTATGGEAGSGEVTFTVDRGSFSNGQRSATATLSAGVASVDYSCDATTDTGCVSAGRARFVATWGTVSSVLDINITVVSGGGTDAGDGGGGNPDAGDGGGGIPDAGDGGAFIPDGGLFVWSVSKNRIFLDVGDSSDVVLTLRSKAGDAGVALPDVPVTIGASLGRLIGSDGGEQALPFTEPTSAQGEVAFRFADNGDAGVATLSALTPWGVQGATSIEITRVQTVTHVSTSCGSVTNCNLMGIKSSGFQESAQVKFKVTDAANRAAVGLTVAFTLQNAPNGTQVTDSAVTNSAGEVTANITSGFSVGTFTVKAAVLDRSATSPGIAIIGAKPTNKGFQFNCAKLNLAAYASATPPAVVATTCTARLVDRFGNAVGTGPSVNFKSEAGTITAALAAKKAGTTPSDTDGTATVPFNTGGVFPPSDVDPLDADFTQLPLREAEPAVGGTLVKNPRDGLVAIIAYLPGEEWFDDANNNGVRDDGEQFYDQGEPFVDDNDNGVRDTGEDPVDLNGNNTWDGPNGVWDQNTTVWTETRVLYTDVPDQTLARVEPAQFSGACGVDELDTGATKVLKPFFPDRHLNRVAQGTTLTIAKSNRATVGLNGAATMTDGYGIGLDRLAIDTVTGLPCASGSSVCRYVYRFTTWSGGHPGTDGFVTAPSNLTSCAAETVTLRATMNSTNYSAVSEGFLGTQPPPPDAGPGTILISATPARIYVDAEDSARIVATLKSLPDGGGVPVSGESVTLVTDLGQFLNSDGTFTGTSLPGTTDGKGQVIGRFGDDGTAGMATISGSTARGAVGSRQVEIATLQSISHVTTVCGTVTNCTTMGVRNSGYNETAQVKFKLVDTATRNAEGVRVRFQLVNAPAGTTVNVSGVTNAAGEVTATVSSAPKAGSFQVKAIAITGSIEVTSPTIAIIRARPTNRGFNITCPNTVPAFATASPPRIETVNCTMRLVDIGNAGVTTRPTVQFLTEAGTLNATTAQAANDGTVTLGMTTGGTLPDDVAPFAANPAQAPLPRDAEPSSAGRNPRDGLVTVVAFVPGEEYFVDNNNNGTWDSGEQFYDQGEPFVDRNDNGVRDVGEDYHDADQDGAWDGPNGRWDGDASTYVWSEARILYTGLADAANSRVEPAVFAGTCGAGELPSGQSVLLAGIFRDLNLNRLPSGTKVTVVDSATNTASTPTIEGSDTVAADGFGYRIDRTLLDAATNLPCTSTSASCVYQPLFSNFETGAVTARARLTLPSTVATCEQNTVTMTATLPSTLATSTASANSTGAVGTQALGDGGTPDAGPGAILLAAAPSKLFVEVNDVSTVTATLKSLPDGGGYPVSGQEVVFGTTLGVFTDSAGTGTGLDRGITDMNGQVVVYVKDEDLPGTAVVSASTVAGASGSKQIDFVNVQSIEHRSTICGSASCILLGAKGSGYNEQALVKFRVLDSASQPVPNARVEFELDPPTAPATVSSWAITNAQGEAVANVTSGASTGAFAIKATVRKTSDPTAVLVEARSPTIGVTGARAVNNGFTFSCNQVNIPAGVSNTPPREVTVKCDVRLVDRYGNPVGTGPSVNFKSEAGTIPAAAQLKVYKPDAPTGDDGTVTVDFVSGGVYPAADVAVDDLEPEYLTAPEPTAPGGVAGVVRNPRDGLVSLIVYLNGEESFTDTNQNGEWDTGERFFDQGEPLVDYNDNGRWNPELGEFFVDVDKNGSWTPPNNSWDRSTTIWSETRVLFTGPPASFISSDGVSYADFFPKGLDGCPGLAANTSASFDLWFPDQNLNRTAPGTTVSATAISGTGGTIGLAGLTTLIDGYGFGIERLAFDAALPGRPCTGTSTSCVWRYRFGDWSRGELSANLSVSAGSTDQICSVRTIRVTSTLLSSQLSKDINVAIGTRTP